MPAPKSSVIDCGVDLERVRAARCGCGAGGGRLVAERNGLPLRRLAQRAQERAPARAGVRAARRGRARVRRRRPAAGRARGPAGHPPRRHRRARPGRGLDRRRRRRLPAEPRRAVRPRDARGPRVGTIGRRDDASAGRRSSCRPDAGVLVDPLDDDALRAGARCGGAAPASQPRCPDAPPRRTTSGGRRSGWRSFWFVLQLLEIGKPDLDERPHRVLEPRRAGGLERRHVALAHLVERRRPA